MYFFCVTSILEKNSSLGKGLVPPEHQTVVGTHGTLGPVIAFHFSSLLETGPNGKMCKGPNASASRRMARDGLENDNWQQG